MDIEIPKGLAGDSLWIGRKSYQIFSRTTSKEADGIQDEITLYPRLTCTIATLQRWAEAYGGMLVRSEYIGDYSIIEVVYRIT